MFIQSADYEARIKELIKDSSDVRIAVAFWGQGAQDLLKCRQKNASVKIICNLLSGATNPAPIRELMNADMVVHTLDTLHAKVIIGDSSMIAGSANFSANGMTLSPEELDGWHEAALLTTDATDLKAAKAWFDGLMKKAVKVNSDHLDKAQELWDQQRRSRAHAGRRKSAKQLSASIVKGLGIQVAFYTESPSTEAIATNKALKKDLGSDPVTRELAKGLDFFEDWGNMLPDACPIIEVKHDGHKVIGIDGPWKRLADYDRSFQNDEEGVSTIQVVKKEKLLAGMRFGKDARALIEQAAAASLKALLKTHSKSPSAFVIDLYELLETGLPSDLSGTEQ